MHNRSQSCAISFTSARLPMPSTTHDHSIHDPHKYAHASRTHPNTQAIMAQGSVRPSQLLGTREEGGSRARPPAEFSADAAFSAAVPQLRLQDLPASDIELKVCGAATARERWDEGRQPCGQGGVASARGCRVADAALSPPPDGAKSARAIGEAAGPSPHP